MPEIEAVILAGGRSRRMGRDKSLLPFGGYPTLAEYQYRRLARIFSRVSLSSKEGKFTFDAPLIPDRSEQFSPMIALASILEGAEAKAVFVLGVDMPFVEKEVIEELRKASSDKPLAEIVVARSPTGVEPLCAIYRRSLLPKIEKLIASGNHRLRSLLETSPTLEIPFSETGPFVNLNHPEEYERARRTVGSG